jgi:DNA-binding transcriptional LysR family regulator
MGDPSLDAPITLDQLRVFLTVVDEGSFSRAAKRLRRVQSAVSYSIANLERLLSVELFDRSGRMPVLTDAGKALLADARAVCERMDQLHARARSIAEGVEARLSLAVDVLFPMPTLLDALHAFSERFPLVPVHLRSEALGAVAQLVVNGTCQVGIGVGLEDLPRELRSRPLISIEMIPVAAPGHRLGRADGVLDTDLVRDEVQIVVSDRSSLTEGQDRGVFSERSWRVADLDSKREMILAGFGWGLMPLHRVEEDLTHRRLVRLQLRAVEAMPGYYVALHAMHRAADPPGPAARWLLERLAG